MQERYLGDSHDYVKYALLRAISNISGEKLGINWYLTEKHSVDLAKNNDGEKRHHLRQSCWSRYDAILVEKLRHFEIPENRIISAFHGSRILHENTKYYEKLVPQNLEQRQKWHSCALRHLEDCKFVFLDPDNGFEVTSATRNRKAKYALHDEVDDYRRRGQSVITIQFARQCNPVKRAEEIRKIRSARFPADANMLVMRARTAPNLLFFFSAPNCERKIIEASVDSLAQGLPEKIEVIRFNQ